MKYTAVHNGKYFDHFGIHKKTASLYGNKVEEIVDVSIEIADNQELPVNDLDVDYWGWWDEDEQKFTLVYAARFLLNMCFPAGIKVTEESGKGKAYRVNVKKL